MKTAILEEALRHFVAQELRGTISALYVYGSAVGQSLEQNPRYLSRIYAKYLAYLSRANALVVKDKSQPGIYGIPTEYFAAGSQDGPNVACTTRPLSS